MCVITAAHPGNVRISAGRGSEVTACRVIDSEKPGHVRDSFVDIKSDWHFRKRHSNGGCSGIIPRLVACLLSGRKCDTRSTDEQPAADIHQEGTLLLFPLCHQGIERNEQVKQATDDVLLERADQ